MNDKKTPMTPDAASRIQSDADKNQHNQDFKERAQSAAAKNEAGKAQGGKPGQAQPQGGTSSTPKK